MATEPRHFDVEKVTLREISQSLLEVKKMGRSMENAADAFIPLTSNPGVVELLNTIAAHAQQAASASNELYKLIAREAASA